LLAHAISRAIVASDAIAANNQSAVDGGAGRTGMSAREVLAVLIWTP
jgi:hypothetical protein